MGMTISCLDLGVLRGYLQGNREKRKDCFWHTQWYSGVGPTTSNYSWWAQETIWDAGGWNPGLATCKEVPYLLYYHWPHRIALTFVKYVTWTLNNHLFVFKFHFMVGIMCHTGPTPSLQVKWPENESDVGEAYTHIKVWLCTSQTLHSILTIENQQDYNIKVYIFIVLVLGGHMYWCYLGYLQFCVWRSLLAVLRGALKPRIEPKPPGCKARAQHMEPNLQIKKSTLSMSVRDCFLLMPNTEWVFKRIIVNGFGGIKVRYLAFI